ncbi:hypothetical protein F443_02599 [Phytophthora nicotianae P1569]|uniref:Uncharacterized protein n=1 Tax=Phytophthora nicotianae P1569 TaxID=1317065 RepID=V9FU70_PHYNI|nr:hypothetical protein F443_02599 [Phytophthora nicotianae P1569]
MASATGGLKIIAKEFAIDSPWARLDGSNSPGKEYQFVALSTRATTTFTDKEKIEVELAAKILELGDAAFKSHVKTVLLPSSLVQQVTDAVERKALIKNPGGMPHD